MSWLVYAGATVVFWSLWGFLGKLALKTATPVQSGIVYGFAVMFVGAVALALGQRTASWTPSATWLAALAGLAGGCGLIAFYLALERGKASLVTPVVGIYPAFVVVLSVLFLSERITVVQLAGVLLALIGVVLIGAGS